MKIVTLFIFIISINLYSQDIEYQLYVKNCDSSITKSWFYSLKKGDVEFSIENIDNPIIKVTDSGIYSLTCEGIDETYDVEISKENYRDTLNFNPIAKIVRPTSFKNGIDENGQCLNCKTIYKKCDRPLNGKQIEKYNNGKLKISGTFKNGIAIGEVVEYYQSGIVKSKITYNNDGDVVNKVDYDSEGNIKEK